MTPLVAAPSDTNLSDATAFVSLLCTFHATVHIRRCSSLVCKCPSGPCFRARLLSRAVASIETLGTAGDKVFVPCRSAFSLVTRLA